MSDKRDPRKERTRGHVVADLGVNHVERQVLLAGFTMERKFHDYGLDTHMTTHARKEAARAGYLDFRGG